MLWENYLFSPFCDGDHWVGELCCCSVARSCPTPCDPMDCSLPGFPVPHHLLDFAKVHVQWMGDAIQPSHPLLFPLASCPQSFPASGSFPMSQLFTSGGQSTGATPSSSPRVCSNSGPLSHWCHPIIPSSVMLFSSCPQSFPASGIVMGLLLSF